MGDEISDDANVQDAPLSEPGPELDRLAREVIGAAIEVHRVLGPGFLESVYRNALCVEMELRGIPYQREVKVPVMYKGEVVGTGQLDLLVGGMLIVELKTVEAIAPIHMAQVIAYLANFKQALALLINFNVRILKDGVKRIVRSR